MDKNEVIKQALYKACKYLRDHPPADAAWESDIEILGLIVDAKSDPRGLRWLAYFLDQVLKESQEEKE